MSKSALDNILNDATQVIELMIHNDDLFPKASLSLEEVISPEIELKAEVSGKGEIYNKVISLLKKISEPS